jgi:hypothetical protein
VSLQATVPVDGFNAIATIARFPAATPDAGIAIVKLVPVVVEDVAPIVLMNEIAAMLHDEVPSNKVARLKRTAGNRRVIDPHLCWVEPIVISRPNSTQN